MTVSRNSLVGIGLYTVAEASRLTRVPSRRITRWVRGYTYKIGQDERASEAVWRSALREYDGFTILSFMDLIEVRFIDAFRRHGVSWKTIRLAAQRAREISNQVYPFATRRFKSDGRSIFAELGVKTRNRRLIDLAKNQYEFHQVVSPSLYVGLEFTDGDQICRWWPLGTRRRIVIDPRRSFGQPIVAREGVPTAILAAAYKVEESVDRVAKWYDVEPRAVRDAVEYEQKLAA